MSVGDWVQGKSGVSNSREVRNALDALKAIDIVVPVWRKVNGSGAHAIYQVDSFALVRLIDYQLPQQARIAVRFLGYKTCADN